MGQPRLRSDLDSDIASLLSLPKWAGTLANLYWHLRACRSWDSAERRKWYREIGKEKIKLVNAGVIAIELHLTCRVLASPRSQTAKERFHSYFRNPKISVWNRSGKN